MRLIYQIGIRIFLGLIRLAALRNPKAKKWVDGRKGLMNQIEQTLKEANNTYWVHCASLGEFEQGRPLIEAIKEQNPEQKVLLTFFSPSGYEVQKNYKLADFVFYLPADTRRNAKRLVKAARPRAVFFIKYEFWYNFLHRLNKEKVPVYFVSAIFRKEQLFFKWYGSWYRKLPAMATHLFVQDESSVKLLQSIGINKVTLTGDTRFDRVARIVRTARPLPWVEKFLNGQQAIVAGSSWKAEEALLMQYLRLKPELKVIVAPHEVTPTNMERIEKLFGEKAILYSKITKQNPAGKQVLIIDCYGLLVSLYQYGQIALIGGGFGVGIHNILEAATFGMPILFGPNYSKFKEAVDLVEKQCAFPVQNIEEFNTVMNQLLVNNPVREAISRKAAGYVMDNTGSTKAIMEKVLLTSNC